MTLQRPHHVAVVSGGAAPRVAWEGAVKLTVHTLDLVLPSTSCAIPLRAQVYSLIYLKQSVERNRYISSSN